jgi:hypothetical protein
MHVLRLSAVLLSLFTCAAPSLSLAQTTLRLKWGNPKRTCVFTTDNTNVSMDAVSGDLVADGSFAGSDCPSGGGGVQDPVITNGLDASELPGTVNPGSTLNISWAADADSCTYANSVFPTAVANWPTQGAGATACSGTAGCAANHPVSVTLNTPGSYTFALTCSRTGSPNTATASRTITVQQGGTECVAPGSLTRLARGTVRYNDGNSRTIDLDLFENVFGHDQEGGPLRLFPGTANLNQRIMIPRNNYVSLKFTVPANFNNDTRGRYRLEETTNATPGSVADAVLMTISKDCGDFGSPQSPMNANCIVDGNELNAVLPWGNVSQTSRCELAAGQTYYLNILHARRATPTTSTCGQLCGNVIQNERTSPGGVWPTGDGQPVGD